MEYIKFTRTEFTWYIRLVVAFGLVAILQDSAVDIAHLMFGPLDLFGANPVLYFTGILSFLSLGVSMIASAWLIYRSEKRKQVTDKFWAVLGLLFGPVTVAGYVVWNLCKHQGSILPVEHSHHGVWHTVLQAMRRE